MIDTNNYCVINGMVFINVTGQTVAGKMNYREAYSYAERNRVNHIDCSGGITGTLTLGGV